MRGIKKPDQMAQLNGLHTDMAILWLNQWKYVGDLRSPMKWFKHFIHFRKFQMISLKFLGEDPYTSKGRKKYFVIDKCASTKIGVLDLLFSLGNNAKAISAKLLKLNLENKLEEMGKTR